MAIRKEMRELYPRNWPEIARRIREERGRCEGCGQVGDCITARSPGTRRGNNYLTVHHRDHDPRNCAPSNLAVLCQACHLKQEVRDQGVAKRRVAVERGQTEML